MYNWHSYLKKIVISVALLSNIHAFADEDIVKQNAQTYLKKYETYLYWTLRLPDDAKTDFIQFIEPTTPLTQKLREKWLYHLAKRHDWTNFTLYYRTTDNTGLRCFAQIAQYQLGHRQEAIQNTLPLWLSLTTQQSETCHSLFTLLQHDHAFTQAQMEQRIALALTQNQSAIAQEILTKMAPQHAQEAKMLKAITHDPHQILLLQPGPLAGALYLYGLKLLVTRNLDAAKTIWQHSRTAALLNKDQAQQFLAHLALYKAIRNQPDAEEWFAKVQPEYCNPILQNWEIRYALMQKNWGKIAQITANVSLEHSDPFQLYWRARALGNLKQASAAQTIYQALANKRNYYGFLASHALHQALNFEFEPTSHDQSVLAIYKPITDQIAEYYRNNQLYLAAHSLNEFSMELPKAEKSALIYWVAHHLHWHGKAIYLSTQDDVLKNQLHLRFPLTYQQPIQKLANQYQISPALIYATIRQESTFLENIKSEAGAYGLMQILPRTAKSIAKHAKISYSDSKELFSPEKNIHIGVAYLNTLHKQFKAHPLLMMAAYNAGPKQVRRWLKNNESTETDIWIETLPWQETRDYLKNVISFYAVYQYRMQEKPNLTPFLQPLG